MIPEIENIMKQTKKTNEIIQLINEELNIYDSHELPHEYHNKYNALVEECTSSKKYLEEVSKEKLKRYIKAATQNIGMHMWSASEESGRHIPKDNRFSSLNKAIKRAKWQAKAVDRLEENKEVFSLVNIKEEIASNLYEKFHVLYETNNEAGLREFFQGLSEEENIILNEGLRSWLANRPGVVSLRNAMQSLNKARENIGNSQRSETPAPIPSRSLNISTWGSRPAIDHPNASDLRSITTTPPPPARRTEIPSSAPPPPARRTEIPSSAPPPPARRTEIPSSASEPLASRSNKSSPSVTINPELKSGNETGMARYDRYGKTVNFDRNTQPAN
jgi:hypothetical protein